MKLIKVDAHNPDIDAIKQAADAIRRGELVIFPTETVYGLAADALNEAAVKRVFDAKGRLESQPLPVQIASPGQLDKVADAVPHAAYILADRFWPGPLTLVLEKHPGLSELITARTGRVGVRVPDHAVALALLNELECPIIASSANISGEPPAIDADQAVAQLGETVSVVLDSGACKIGIASTVVDVTTDPPAILRGGAISQEDIFSALGIERLGE